MKLKELREALDSLGDAHEDKPVKIWLPGSRINLTGQVFVHKMDTVLIEGSMDTMEIRAKGDVTELEIVDVEFGNE